ncbi:MAG: rhodanese-like domain-containing protein [Comamonadaceae bacterium]|nr:rhodanese-like domain-containing protein [Comamonadaceae bacterium]
MNFLIENWFLLVAAIVSGGMLLWPMLVSGSQGAALSPAEAVQLINRDKGVLIDVSEPEEFAKIHAVGARNIPFGQIEGHKQLPSNKALPLVLLCPTGARAGRAAGMLRKLGYEKARVLAGGLKAWRDANLPVEKSA